MKKVIGFLAITLVVSIALIPFTVIGKGKPFGEIWEAIYELQSRVETLEELENRMLPQGFMRAPAYDSGWVIPADGGWRSLEHNLDTTEVFVYVQGQWNGDVSYRGGISWGLNSTHISVTAHLGYNKIRVMIWKIQEPPT